MSINLKSAWYYNKLYNEVSLSYYGSLNQLSTCLYKKATIQTLPEMVLSLRIHVREKASSPHLRISAIDIFSGYKELFIMPCKTWPIFNIHLLPKRNLALVQDWTCSSLRWSGKCHISVPEAARNTDAPLLWLKNIREGLWPHANEWSLI